MKEKLFQSTLLVSLMTFLSRIMGFVRDIVIARFFGAGVGADVFQEVHFDTRQLVQRHQRAKARGVTGALSDGKEGSGNRIA